MRLLGIVEEIGKTIKFGDDFEKKTVVIKDATEERVTSKFAIDFMGNHMEKVKGIKVGQKVVVKFDGRVGEGEDGKRYQNLNGYLIEDVANMAQTTSTPSPAPAGGDDLPF